MRVAALVDDLLDRSKLAAAVPATTFVREPGAAGPADVVVVDLESVEQHCELVMKRTNHNVITQPMKIGTHVGWNRLAAKFPNHRAQLPLRVKAHTVIDAEDRAAVQRL